ncbi:MAG: hypothetical protein U0694_22220 [Anaerolineae bacterium]
MFALRKGAKLFSLVLLLWVTALGFFSSVAAAQSAYELEPVALCVRDLGIDANPRYEAHFGYRNNTDSTYFIPEGTSGSGINIVSGGFAQPALPTSFDLGASPSWPSSAFYVAFNVGSVTWTLGTSNDLATSPAVAFLSEYSPACAYEIIVDKVWIDVNGEGTFIPPLDLTPEWRLDMTAFDSSGQATGAYGNCVYLLPDPTLRCAYSNPNSNVTDRLIVPEGGSYEVIESPSLAPDWIPAEPSGLGQFSPVTVYCESPYNNDASDCYHLVRNRAGTESGAGTLIINKFNDLDGDGVQDAEDLPIDGFTFNVSADFGTVAGSPFPTTAGTTGQINLPAGVYAVSENMPDQCWVQTTGPNGAVFVMADSTTTLTFGNHNICTTPTETPTEPPTETVTPTDVPTETVTPTDTPTETVTPTDTPTDVPTETVTPTDTPTDVPTETVTPTDTPTDVPTETATPTDTPTDVPTETATPTDTPTDVPTETVTPTDTPTETATPTETPTDGPLAKPEPQHGSPRLLNAACDGHLRR